MMRRLTAIALCAAFDAAIVALPLSFALGTTVLGVPAQAQTPAPVSVAISQEIRAIVEPKSFAMHIEMPSREDDRDWDLPVKDQETIRKSFPLGAGRKTIEIDNVNGSIEVTGGTSNEVQLVVNKTLRAETKSKLEEARTKVTLDITQESDLLKFYVNGPFRCPCQDCVSFHGDEGYSVKMDFVLQIPRDVDIRLKTVNSGQIKVKNVIGSFVVRNVNGGIEMQDMAGSGLARTVNGAVHVTFRENPKEASSFGSINGAVELRFQRNLAADFRFKTFNGGVYTDFAVATLPAGGMKEERRDGKVVYRADRYTGARVGNGGPEIKVDNLNGDIRILENHE
jgi:hypothetical protein